MLAIDIQDLTIYIVHKSETPRRSPNLMQIFERSTEQKCPLFPGIADIPASRRANL